MPDFNYENPRNIRGDTMEPPEEHLFKLVLEVLAYEGYQSMTMEEIQGKGGSKELITGYGTKENLCLAALEDASEKVSLVYERVTEDARAYLRDRGHNREEGWKQLERLLYRHIYLCFHPKNRIYVLAAAQESQLPAGLQQILPDMLQKCFGDVLSQMIFAVSEVKNEQMAAMSACVICGGINIFVHQPVYCKNIFTGRTGKKPNYAVVEDLLNNHFLRAVAADTAINKQF